MTNQPLGPWLLPQDLEELHDVVIEFAVAAHTRSDTNHAKSPQGPLSYKALERLHRTSICTHRSVKSLCVAGWTVTTPAVLRILVDILVSMVAIAENAADAEYMGFRFMAHSLIEGMHDPYASPGQPKLDATQVDILKSFLSPSDAKRADVLIASYAKKVPPYWYAPGISSPGNAIGQKMPRLRDLWRAFCGATHGADIGSVLFADNPDSAGINPEENPRKTRMAIVISSRFLLDTSHARATFEGIADAAEYKRIVRDFIQPQEAKTNK